MTYRSHNSCYFQLTYGKNLTEEFLFVPNNEKECFANLSIVETEKHRFYLEAKDNETWRSCPEILSCDSSYHALEVTMHHSREDALQSAAIYLSRKHKFESAQWLLWMKDRKNATTFFEVECMYFSDKMNPSTFVAKIIFLQKNKVVIVIGQHINNRGISITNCIEILASGLSAFIKKQARELVSSQAKKMFAECVSRFFSKNTTGKTYAFRELCNVFSIVFHWYKHFPDVLNFDFKWIEHYPKKTNTRKEFEFDIVRFDGAGSPDWEFCHTFEQICSHTMLSMLDIQFSAGSLSKYFYVSNPKNISNMRTEKCLFVRCIEKGGVELRNFDLEINKEYYHYFQGKL